MTTPKTVPPSVMVHYPFHPLRNRWLDGAKKCQQHPATETACLFASRFVRCAKRHPHHRCSPESILRVGNLSNPFRNDPPEYSSPDLTLTHAEENREDGGAS